MNIETLWLSQQGTRTSDNRDHAGIGIRQGEFLGVVVDGSTNGVANGEYARAITQMLVDWFVDTGEVITDDVMVQVLRQLHENLRKRYPRGSASLLLIHATGRCSIRVVHSGDCVLGKPFLGGCALSGSCERFNLEEVDSLPLEMSKKLGPMPIEIRGRFRGSRFGMCQHITSERGLRRAPPGQSSLSVNFLFNLLEVDGDTKMEGEVQAPEENKRLLNAFAEFVACSISGFGIHQPKPKGFVVGVRSDSGEAQLPHCISQLFIILDGSSPQIE
ncbi:hypothetical protein [Sinorhizobium alkalisoli]|uniref:hypothetical protein n=1 Tax=Sinorhizobium alkalisoli TaxID=1752398 RepID=UPI0010428414|nr:hypothetical protein [Sinorhizobium alkalisoli]